MAKNSRNAGKTLTVGPAGTEGPTERVGEPAGGEQRVKLGELTVQLAVDGRVVASSQDPRLWQDVLAAITGHAPQSLRHSSQGVAHDTQGSSQEVGQGKSAAQGAESGDTHGGEFSADVIKFAKDIGVPPEEVAASCDPRDEEPYLHLDHRAWEQMKAQTPSSGPHAISPIIPAATLLALWFRQKKLGNPTVRQAQVVLGTLNLRDGNPARGMKSREWLQLKDGKIVLNPARLSRAQAFAKSFCSHKWKQEDR